MPAQESCPALEDWLGAGRAAAWRSFLDAPDPAPTVETWRRFPFSTLDFVRLRASDAPELPGIAPGSAAGSGVAVMTLEEAARRHPELVRPELAGLRAEKDFHKLEAANLALWRQGAFIHVPKGTTVASPIHITFYHDPGAPFSFPRALVLVEEGSSATVIERHVGAPGDLAARPKSAAFSRVVVGRGANVRLFYIQELAPDAGHFWHQRVELARDSTLTHHSIVLGAERHKSELEVSLQGPGARSEIRGILLGRGSQFFDPRTKQLHSAGGTASDLSFLTVLGGKARSIYTGLVRIEADAPDCEAYQSNRNLLLSDAARADSTPILEILPSAVRCKHAATAGALDPDEVFYLKTRGIPEDEATRMLVRGFFDPILSAVPDEAVREGLAAQIERGIAGL